MKHLNYLQSRWCDDRFFVQHTNSLVKFSSFVVFVYPTFKLIQNAVLEKPLKESVIKYTTQRTINQSNSCLNALQM